MSDQHQSSLIVASNMSSSYLIKIVLVYALASSASALTDDTPVDLPAPSPNTSPQSGFYQYVNVPSPFEYEFGFNVGNSNHYVSRFEQFKNTAFRTMVKWSDSDEGYGQHVFEYNHGGDSDDYSDSSYKSRKPKQLNSAQFAATPAPYAQPNQRVPFPENNKQDYSTAKTRAPSAYGQPVQRSVTTTSPIKLKPIETSAASKLLIQPKFTAPSFIKYERGFESQAAKRGVIAKRIPTFLVDNNP